MAEKILNTRIQLKYDTWANWLVIKDTFFPKRGEVCLVELPSTPEGQTVPTNPPTVLFKVGTWDGTDATKKSFAQLDWVSAKAADVHAWAKKSEADFITWVKTLIPLTIEDNGTGKFITDITVKENANGAHTIVVSRGNIVWNDITDKPVIPVVNDAALTLNAGEGLSADQTVFTANDADAQSFTVSHGAKPQSGTAAASTAGSGRTYVTEVSIDKFGHVAGVKTATETVVDTNTAHTHENGLGTVVTNAGGIDEESVAVNLNIGIKLDTKTENNNTTNTLVIYDKTSNTEIASMDAADFVEDSYLTDVTVDDSTSTITLTFALKDGSSKVATIDLSHLVDVYTGSNGITVDGYNISLDEETIEKIDNKLDKPDVQTGHYVIYDSGELKDAGIITGLSTVSSPSSGGSDSGVFGFDIEQFVDSQTSPETIVSVYLEASNGIEIIDESPLEQPNTLGKIQLASWAQDKLSNSITDISTGVGLISTNISSSGDESKNIHIDFDSEVVFVFNCGSATDNI